MSEGPIRSAVATFAVDISEPVRAAIREADSHAAAGEPERALDLLREVASRLEPGSDVDDDRIVIGEVVAYLCSGTPLMPIGLRFLDDLIEGTAGPLARGALLFHRGRIGRDAEPEILRRALVEFARARDIRGRAVTLASMSWPTVGISADQRRRMAREGLALAVELGDAWVIAYCASLSAGARAYLGDMDALDDYGLAAEQLVARTDPVTAHLAMLNQINWGLSAFMLGDYEQARRIFADGLSISTTEVCDNRFASGIQLADWRMGRPPRPLPNLAGGGRELHTLLAAAETLETARQVGAEITEQVVDATGTSMQLRWLAVALQARMRVARNEPNPLRDLPAVIAEAVETETRLAWEDALLALAEHDPEMAAVAFDQVASLWPDGVPRMAAVRQACVGLLAGCDGYADLVAAAEEFIALPEPATAGRLLHRAARVAPTRTVGNSLRRQALDLLTAARDDRSATAVLRDRTLPRGATYTPVPAQFVGVTTAGLTRREHEVAVLAAQGLTAQEIADTLTLSVSTVRHHLQRARAKFGGVPKRRLARLLASGD